MSEALMGPGGMFNPVLLWSNTNTTFVAQTVTIRNLTSYKWLVIAYSTVGLSPIQYMPFLNISGSKIELATATDTNHFRTITINGDSLNFSDNYYYTTYNSSVTKVANTHGIPLAIYGVK